MNKGIFNKISKYNKNPMLYKQDKYIEVFKTTNADTLQNISENQEKTVIHPSTSPANFINAKKWDLKEVNKLCCI